MSLIETDSLISKDNRRSLISKDNLISKGNPRSLISKVKSYSNNLLLGVGGRGVKEEVGLK